MPRFTIKDLMVAMGLVAGGLGLGRMAFLIASYFHTVDTLAISVLLAGSLWAGSGAMVGAGLLYPAKQPALGFYLGVMVAMGVFVPFLYVTCL